MTESIQTTESAPAEVPDKGLVARTLGVIFSPRDTFVTVAAHPRWLLMLTVVILLTVVPIGWFMTTEVGRRAALDQAERGLKLFASFIPAEQMARQRELMARQYMEGSVLRVAGWPIASIVIVWPIIAAIYAALLMVLKAMLGAPGTYKQVYAVVVHSWVISALAALFLTPLNYVRESMDSATSLRIFLPMLDDGSFVASLLGSVDLFRVWELMVLSIGLAVLFRRKTATVAVSLFCVYGVIALGYATIAAMLAARS